MPQPASADCKQTVSKMEDTVVLGKISGVFGVRGWVKVRSFTQRKEDILAFSEWLIADRRYTPQQGQIHGKGLIAKLEGIEDRDQAFELNGLEIKVARRQLPEPQENEFYWSDLHGCEVSNLDGEQLGTVDDLIETGANDVMVLRGERERLIPFTRNVILEVDLAGRRIQVDWEADF